MTKNTLPLSQELKSRYEKVVEDYIKAFSEKHGFGYPDVDIWWVAGEIGGVLYISDYWLDFRDIKYDIDNNAPETAIFEWYDYVVELAELEAKTVTFANWLKGVRPYSDETLDEIRELHARVLNSKSELERLINETII